MQELRVVKVFGVLAGACVRSKVEGYAARAVLGVKCPRPAASKDIGNVMKCRRAGTLNSQRASENGGVKDHGKTRVLAGIVTSK